VQEVENKENVGVLCRVVLSSTMYNLWRAINEIKQNGRIKTKGQILQMIF
jgi:hypothetical protein